jgi:CheY-like chemotaxis protein
LAKLHGGTIVAKSEGKGRGSSFTLRLPLIQSAQLSVQLPLGSKSRAKIAEGYEVLIVDDNIAAAESLAALLETKGHHVMLAHNGSDAIEVVGRSPPDLAIIDIGLPDIDGHTLAKRLTKNGFSGVLIALSGFGQPEDKARSRSSGFRRHLTKPATLADIENVLPIDLVGPSHVSG